jgi:hypothetical protein
MGMEARKADYKRYVLCIQKRDMNRLQEIIIEAEAER